MVNLDFVPHQYIPGAVFFERIDLSWLFTTEQKIRPLSLGHVALQRAGALGGGLATRGHSTSRTQ